MNDEGSSLETLDLSLISYIGSTLTIYTLICISTLPMYQTNLSALTQKT